MEKINKYIFFVIIVLVFILRISGLYQPILDIDESVFSEFANIILDGGLPYIDAIDNKPPLNYYFFALVFKVFGKNNLPSVHLVTIFIVIATSIFVYLLTKEIFNKRAGVISALLFVFLAHTYEPKYISTSGETLINLPVIISIFIYMKFRALNLKHLFLFVFSGMLLGISILLNYKAGIYPILIIIHGILVLIIFRGSDNFFESLKQEFIKLLVTGISAMVPVFLVMLYFYNIGNIEEFLYWGFNYNFGYISSGVSSQPFLKSLARTSYFIFCSLPAWIIVLVFVKRDFIINIKEIIKGKAGYGNLNFIFLILWLVFSFYSALIGGRTYGHYFIQIIIPLSILTSAAYDKLFVENNGYTKAFWAFFIVTVMIFSLSRVNIGYTYKLINYPNRKAFESYEKV
ncbi:ArnT family glycosyltransferase, partial [Spirochaetota bacterium]